MRIPKRIGMSVILTGLLLTLTVNSVFAAAKVVDASGQNIPFTISGFNLCGPSTDVVGAFSFHFVLWDNGHFELSLVSRGNEIDTASGEEIGSGGLRLHEAGEASGLPYQLQSNFTGTCWGSGPAVNTHIGITIDENGNVHLH
ncbi:MAG: hypothetical protein HY685_04390 [Chloroflexi bacterium]|nr:hypothetical protein [Chloroflexota bacterium]